LLFTQSRDVLLLKPVLRGAMLSLQLYALLRRQALLLVQLVAILHKLLLLFTDPLLLLLLWQAPLSLSRLGL
jgi:hypothetical protein